jgi:hypothetical protein
MPAKKRKTAAKRKKALGKEKTTAGRRKAPAKTALPGTAIARREKTTTKIPWPPTNNDDGLDH